MPDVIETDILVLGGGPGGYGAAFHAADRGVRVTLLDAAARPGGTCLHVGCIPSKALLHVAKLITDARDSDALGLHFEPPKIDVAGVRNHWMSVVDKLSQGLVGLCKRRKVNLVNGRGKFVDSQTVEVDNGNRIRYRHCVLATGSTPFIPSSLKLDSPRVMDSTGALRLDELPKSLLVVGGGYIGLELGYVYAALGSAVTVVEALDGLLLPAVDRDLVEPLQERLTGLFKEILLNTSVQRLVETPHGIKATLKGKAEEKEVTFDRVLIAVGRRPVSGNLGLENTKVKVNEKGFVLVDAQRRTADDKIYAIGDVAGEPMLAHKATYEGRVAVEAILGDKVAYEPRAVPAVVFTDPEIAWCGLTETEAKAANREVKIARYPWIASGRAATLGRQEGLTKLLADPKTDVVLGVGIVGTDAGELIGEGVLAVEMASTALDLALSMHPHPTLTETMGESGELLHGGATHWVAPRSRAK
jgi:dihydrolipoamide dehydrogenase